MRVLKSTSARVLTAALVLHGGIFYGLSREENPPLHRALNEFPAVVGGWRLLQQGVVEDAVQEVLQADDTLVRLYRGGATGTPAHLYVAYFQSQRTGVNPHSPKHCLPGAGWAPTQSDIIQLSVPGRPDPISVNHYIISKGDQQSVVLYWYQGRGRVIASEYFARAYLVADSIRYNRSDTSLVRIIVPVQGGDQEAADEAAIEFASDCFPHLSQFLPD